MKPALPRTCQRLNRCCSLCTSTPHPSSEGQFLGCDELLQLNLATAHEAKGWIHRSWTIHLPLVKAPHGVGVVKVHPARVVIQANAQPLWHGKYAVAGVTGCGSGRWGNGGGWRGFGDEELAHADSEEGEGLWELVARVLTATVMAAIVVIPGHVGGRKQKNKKNNTYVSNNNNKSFNWLISKFYCWVRARDTSDFTTPFSNDSLMARISTHTQNDKINTAWCLSPCMHYVTTIELKCLCVNFCSFTSCSLSWSGEKGELVWE